mgnify:CR=1 FL=1
MCYVPHDVCGKRLRDDGRVVVREGVVAALVYIVVFFFCNETATTEVYTE